QSFFAIDKQRAAEKTKEDRSSPTSSSSNGDLMLISQSWWLQHRQAEHEGHFVRADRNDLQRERSALRNAPEKICSEFQFDLR
ncbi:MAG TPA: hypothetical protein ACN46L_00595, partial [Prochlorococcus sp.]